MVNHLNLLNPAIRNAILILPTIRKGFPELEAEETLGLDSSDEAVDVMTVA